MYTPTHYIRLHKHQRFSGVVHGERHESARFIQNHVINDLTGVSVCQIYYSVLHRLSFDYLSLFLSLLFATFWSFWYWIIFKYGMAADRYVLKQLVSTFERFGTHLTFQVCCTGRHRWCLHQYPNSVSPLTGRIAHVTACFINSCTHHWVTEFCKMYLATFEALKRMW